MQALIWAFLEIKLTFSAEYYERFTDNLIYNVPVAPSAGFPYTTTVNIASMKSWGYEFVAGFNESVKAFKWSISANVGITKNNVISLNSPKDVIDAGNGGSDYGGSDVTRTEAWPSHSIFFLAGKQMVYFRMMPTQPKLTIKKVPL